jgi:hypothetical protein
MQYILTLVFYFSAAGSSRLLLWACQVYRAACPSRSCDTTLVARATTHLPYPTLPCMYQYTSSHTLNLCLLYYYTCTYSILNVSMVGGTKPVWCHAPCCNSARARRKQSAHMPVDVRAYIPHKRRASDCKLGLPRLCRTQEFCEELTYTTCRA